MRNGGGRGGYDAADDFAPVDGVAASGFLVGAVVAEDKILISTHDLKGFAQVREEGLGPGRQVGFGKWLAIERDLAVLYLNGVAWRGDDAGHDGVAVAGRLQDDQVSASRWVLAESPAVPGIAVERRAHAVVMNLQGGSDQRDGETVAENRQRPETDNQQEWL